MGFNDEGEEDNNVWRWVCDEEMKEVKCHIIVISHIHFTVNYLDDVSEKDLIEKN